MGSPDREGESPRSTRPTSPEVMAQRPPSEQFRLRDRPYLIACAAGGALLVVLVIVAVAYLVPPASSEKTQAAPLRPAVPASTMSVAPARPPADISYMATS